MRILMQTHSIFHGNDSELTSPLENLSMGRSRYINTVQLDLQLLYQTFTCANPIAS